MESRKSGRASLSQRKDAAARSVVRREGGLNTSTKEAEMSQPGACRDIGGNRDKRC